ncbi:MAG: zf-HC2 domain-containing protein [Lachnospiraceae bacterium]|nr:zf-HC2 domain-containing protein [Lachnospiraceae bacterium]
MNCQEAERLVMPYICDELSNEELEEFLEHVASCPNCQEELEIYFMVALGLKQLDSGSGNYNIKGELEAALESSYQRVHFDHFMKVAHYAMSTLAAVGLLTTFLLQMRIWFIG